MCDVEMKLNASWQLVSQFVSWDFCRYMCEQNENQPTETDVLTFLRNMVVSRTEKRATDITKHEIVAKFIMETRTTQSKSRLPIIIALSETVMEICPELKSSVRNLLHHLESLLNVLDWNEDSQKDELILARIGQSVNEFTVEACKLLPLPDLLQVVSSWIDPELQAQIWKSRQKNGTNIELCQQVVRCLQEETITYLEAETIAKALYEDKKLERIINSETEIEPDSQQNSPSVHSFHLQPRPTHSEQSLQPSSQHSSIPEKQLDSAGLFTLEPVFPPSQPLRQPQNQFIQASLPFSQNSLDPSEQYRLTEGIQNLGPLNPIESYLFKPTCAEPLFHTLSPKGSKLARPRVDSDDSSLEIIPSPKNARRLFSLENSLSNKKRRKILSSPESDVSPKKKNRGVSSPEPVFYTAPVEPPESNFLLDDSDLSPLKKAPSKNRKKCVQQIDSDLDLSDIEPDHQSIAKQRNSYIQKPSKSRTLSKFFENSGSDTSDCDKNSEFRFLTPTMYKSGQLDQNPAATQGVVWLSEDETHGSSVTTDPPESQNRDPSFYPSYVTASKTSQSLPKTRAKIKAAPKHTKKTQLESPKFTKTPRQATLRGFGFSSTTSNQEESAPTKVVEKKRFKLFDNDMMPKLANESALFQKTTAKKKQKTNKKIEDLGNKRRCMECKKTFRTPTELKKHVFIVHATEDLNSTEEFF